MKAILSFILAVVFSTQVGYAQGWVSYFQPDYFLGPYYISVLDLYELENGNFLSTGLEPGIVMLNSETGDTLWTSNIARGHSVRTTDGGYFIGTSKLNNSFEIEWVVTSTTAVIHEAILSSNDNVYFSGIAYLLYGDAPFPFQYNSISNINTITGNYSGLTILALPIQTLDDWAAGEDNDMVPLLEGNGWMVFAQCNFCHSCLIKNTSGSLTQFCIDDFNAETRSIIHANEGDGYIITTGYRNIAKVDINGNIVWLKIYQTTIPPIIPYSYGFHNITSIGADGYLAVGRTHDDKLWVVKLDNNGNEQWQSDNIKIKNYKTVGKTAIKTSDQGYLIGGIARYNVTPYNETYPFFVKMDSTGNCRPQAAFTHSLNNYTLSIESNTSAGAHEYTWLFGNSDTAQTATPVYTYPYPGTYNLCLVASNPCGNDTLCTQIDVATGINTPNAQTPVLSFYPNPVSANQNIFWQANNISPGAAVQLRVFNLPGNTIYHEMINQHSGTLPSQTWPPGLYFLQLITPTGETTVRLVVTGE